MTCCHVNRLLAKKQRSVMLWCEDRGPRKKWYNYFIIQICVQIYRTCLRGEGPGNLFGNLTLYLG